MNYLSKYIKYKDKYLKLKLGGTYRESFNIKNYLNSKGIYDFKSETPKELLDKSYLKAINPYYNLQTWEKLISQYGSCQVKEQKNIIDNINEYFDSKTQPTIQSETFNIKNYLNSKGIYDFKTEIPVDLLNQEFIKKSLLTWNNLIYRYNSYNYNNNLQEKLIKNIDNFFNTKDQTINNYNDIGFFNTKDQTINSNSKNQKELYEIQNFFKEPKIEFIIPEYVINFIDEDQKLNNLINKNYGDQNIERKYELEITHYLLDKNTFSGLFFHNPTKPNNKIIDNIKLIINEKMDNKILFYKNAYENKDEESRDLMNTLIAVCEDKKEKYNSKFFWNKSKYFKLSEIIFKNTKIENLISTLPKKGSGHKLLCVFLYIILKINNNNFDSIIELKAGSFDVIDKFYKKIGFNCDNYLKCNQTIKELITKCDFSSDIKLILLSNNKYHNNFENYINN
jgi:hypothetical protein